MSGVLDILGDDERAKLERASRPDWTSPMLATLTHDTFSDPEWIFERKLDGERCLVFTGSDGPKLLSRNRKDLNGSYPEIVDSLKERDLDAMVLDGEIVAFDGNVTSFARLQDRMGIKDPDEARRSPVGVYLYLFDILHLEGHDCTGVGQRSRKRLLRKALSFDNRVRFTAHRNEDGQAYLKDACDKGWEGLIAKRADAPYVHSRSKSWLKFKCVNRQEFVIGGFTEPEGDRVGFGALVIGYHDNGDFVCAGKVGTGFDDELLRKLRDRMESHERKTSPFDRGRTPSGGVHWVSPVIVGEVAFTEWTEDGSLRHPRFVGLRRDKEPEDVVREEARAAP